MGLLQLVIEASDVLQELERQLVAGGLHRGRRLEGAEQPIGVRSVEFLGNSACRQRGDQRMESAHQLGPEVADVLVPFGQQTQHLGVIGRLDRPQSR